MSNSTLKGSRSIRGTNPQYLIESVLRNRIYLSAFWKEQCFALNAATIVDKAAELKHVGGAHGANYHPTDFLCLLLKLLQLQPDDEIILEYIKAGSEDMKYLKALGLFYVRLTFDNLRVYEILEPHMKDYRKLRYRDSSGYSLTTVDDFVDHLLVDERYCDIILPRLTKRSVLEETEGLRPRKSLLEAAMNGESLSDHDEDSDEDGRPVLKRPRRSRSRSGTPSSDEDERLPRRFMSRSPSRTPSDVYGSEGEGLQGGYRSRTPSVSPDRELPSRSQNGDDDGYRSRSPSVSPDREKDPRSSSRREGDKQDNGRYVSRSPSRSPDRG